MMSMAAARRRAEEFAAAADGSTTTVTDAETETFLALVEQLRALEAPAPDPVFTASLRSQLMSAACEDLIAAPVERAPAARGRAVEPRRRRVMSIAASACIVAGSGMGVAAASQSALPGDALYPLKRGIENVGVSIAAAPADRGHEYVDAASTRLSEVQALAITRADDPSTSALIAATLDDFVGQADDGAQQLLTAYQQGSSPQSIVELRTFARDSVQQLQVLQQTVPSDVRDDLLDAARTLTRIDAAARDACPVCGTLAPITLSDEFAALQKDLAAPPPVLPPIQPAPTGSQHSRTTSPHRHHSQRHHNTGPQTAPTVPGTVPGTVPTVPAAPAAPMVPTAPAAPAAPAVPMVPTVPTVPTVPAVPMVPTVPTVPGTVPTVPTVPMVPMVPMVPASPDGHHATHPNSPQVPTPTLLTPAPGAQGTPTQFTAPPITGPLVPSIGDSTPSVPLPTSGLVDPSNAVPHIIDPTPPVISGGITLPLPLP